jgi:hypothetical protein
MTDRIHSSSHCRDCDGGVSRRSFLQKAAAGSLAGSMFTFGAGLYAAPSKSSTAETAVGRLYQSLSEKQRTTICLPFDHELRSRISANWHVTEPLIGDDFYTTEQRGIIDEIVKGLTSEEGYEKLVKQMDDDGGGIDYFSCALFGNPEEDKFQWELTGRHLTLRADGNSVDKAAFGGPIIYGHGEENPKDNMYHFQTQQTNKLFQALDAKQAEQALREKAPSETNVALRGKDAPFPGIAGSELSGDQKQLLEETLKVLLAPYREADVEEVMSVLKNAGGVDSLHMAFYKGEEGKLDLDNDKVWDVWRIEGPGFVWHFRGAPHVHAYINIGA